MKIENLIIERKPSYDTKYANLLVGLVQMQGEHGKLEVKLSSDVVANIFGLILADVKRVADYNASQAEHAVTEAQGEQAILSLEAPTAREDDVPF